MMKVFIAILLFFVLLGIRVPAAFTQQGPSYQQLAQEMEVLKERISALQSQLQTVETVEKMKLSAELADAKARLINTEFSTFVSQLRDSNNEWLWKWAAFLGLIIGLALWFSIKSLIENGVEKHLNGFKKALARSDEIQDQLKMLHTEHAVSVLEHLIQSHPYEDAYYRKQTASIPEEALLQVFGDKTRYLQLRLRAADVLAYRKSPLLVDPFLEFLHSIINNDQDYHHRDINSLRHRLVRPLKYIHTQASYQGLKEFLNRLLTEDSGYKRLLLTPTIVLPPEI